MHQQQKFLVGIGLVLLLGFFSFLAFRYATPQTAPPADEALATEAIDEFFLPPDFALENEDAVPDFGTVGYAYMLVSQFLIEQEEYQDLEFEIEIKPSRLRCAGCYVAVVHFSQAPILYLDIFGAEVRPGDDTNLVELD